MRFIYVFTEEDKKKMVLLGYNIIKEDVKKNIFVFENKDPENLNFDLVPHVLSNTLTF